MTTSRDAAGKTAGSQQGRKKPVPPQLSREQRAAGGRAAQAKRLREAGRAPAHETVTVDGQLTDVMTALRDAAVAGSPQAAREYREWLREYGTLGVEPDLNIVSLEDMTPAQRELALAIAERHIARAAKRLAARRERSTVSGLRPDAIVPAHGTLPPDS